MGTVQDLLVSELQKELIAHGAYLTNPVLEMGPLTTLSDPSGWVE